MSITRRKFVKIGSLAPMVYALPFSSLSIFKSTFSENEVAELYKKFQNPSGAARPFVRWWWNGDRVVGKELLRELDMLKEKGISGVEINSIAFPTLDNPMGYKPCDWLSDKWLKMVKTAVDGAKERDMICDIIVGSGWPFGGEFLTKEEQIQLLALGTRKLKGPQKYIVKKNDLLDEMNPLTNRKGYRELSVLRLAPASMDVFNSGIDLNHKIGDEEITIDVPNGDHVLYFLVKLTGFTKVTHGAPGASGTVLNHYKKSAVKKYLNRMSDVINAKIGNMGSLFRALFVDSMEMHGSNWCDDMLEEFKRRNGYALEPYLPFILFKINPKVAYRGDHLMKDCGSKLSATVQDEIDRVRYDFEKTRLALFQERFLDTFTTWCKQNEVQSRVQTYGTVFYPLESAMQVDIPECETWLRQWVGKDLTEDSYSTGRGYRPVNKFISSAARLTGKRQVSCEEETNTTMVFNASLERIKITGDQSNLTGVNHSILHGFNYSPKEIPFPGWVRYGTFFNERNTWWPYLKTWIDYKARLSEIFQQADPQADIAIMFPTVDLWSKHGVQYEQWPQFVEPEYAFNVWEAIHQNGDCCDYIDEKGLQSSTFSEGRLHYGPRSYKILFMLAVESIEPDTAEALQKFAKAGGIIFFIGKEPVKAPGLVDHKKRDNLVYEMIRSLKKDFPKHAVSYPGPKEEIIKWYAEIQSKFNIIPPVKIDYPVSHVSQVHYKIPEADIFFISNYHLEKSHQFKATFSVKDKTAWIWDPETGEKYIYPHEGSKNILKFDLDPTESRLIVFTNEEKGEIYPVRKLSNVDSHILAGAWRVTLNKVFGEKEKIKFDKLIDFKDDKKLKSFAGTILYEKTISLNQPEKYNYLDLGKINNISEVWINNQSLGFKWYGKHIYDLKGTLKSGNNNIKIKIVTVLGNYAKSLKDNKVAQKWTQRQQFYSMGLVGPIRLL